LFYGGGAKQLGVQVAGNLIVGGLALAAGLLLMFSIKAVGLLRVSEEVELGGIDIHEHGAPAYHPEFAFMGHSAIPSGSSSGAGKLPSRAVPPVGVGD
jgi:Amt family ammonium transporter